MVGPSGLEPPTSCLSGTRSNLLSYEPLWLVSDFFQSLEFHRRLQLIINPLTNDLIKMMGFGRDANCASWSPSALTVHRTVIHCLLCSNPFRIWNSSESKSWKDSEESHGGDDGIRTHDPLLAGQVLSQLSYTPISLWSFAFSLPLFLFCF